MSDKNDRPVESHPPIWAMVLVGLVLLVAVVGYFFKY